MKVKFAIAALTACLTACGTAKEDFGTQSAAQDRVVELPPEKRAQVIKNRLFENVWNNSLAGVQAVLAVDARQIHEQNDDGDTPFGLALKNGYRNVALQMLPSVPLSDYAHQNKKGETYVFLAARSGFPEVITQMAETYYKSVNFDYEFSQLDLEDSEGRNALMVAADRRTAEALERQYYKGIGELPGYGFMWHTDNRSRTFVHWAAADGRDDILLWAAERLCRDDYGDWAFYEAPLVLMSWLARSKPSRWLQIHVWGDSGLTPSLIVNTADDDYMTPLHVAVSERRWSSVRALASCKWLDYDLQDAHDDTALHSFLKSLNPYRPQQDQEARDTFAFLFSRNTQTRLYTQDERADRKDLDGDSPLHLAARLSDPFFYQQLAKVGNVNAENAKGVSAASLFKARQQNVSQYGQ